jgi:hypothetical protein
MKRIKLISKKDQGYYKAGQTIRHIEVDLHFNVERLTHYYDFEVIPEIIN